MFIGLDVFKLIKIDFQTMEFCYMCFFALFHVLNVDLLLNSKFCSFLAYICKFNCTFVGMVFIN